MSVPMQYIKNVEIGLGGNLPQLEQKPFTLRNATGQVCNYTIWPPIVKKLVVSISVPPGFTRDLTQEMNLLLSVDKSHLYIYDEEEIKLAAIKIIDHKQEEITINCSMPILKKTMVGDISVNSILTGFKPVSCLNAADINAKQTVFMSAQHVLFDEILGYTCTACKDSSVESYDIILKTGVPFIVLPDGTEVYDNDMGMRALDSIPTFDECLDGTKNRIVHIPCEATVTYEIDPIS